MSPSVRLSLAASLLGSLLPLAACASGGGAGASKSVRTRPVHVLDLMAAKPDSEPLETGPSAKPVKGRRLERAVSRTVEGHRPAFQKCIEDASKKRGQAKARATLVLTVRPDGVVSKAKVAERSVRGKPLGQCLVNASMRMTFPPIDGGPVEVKVPLRLTAQ
jgi:hypothetical protein